VEVLNEVEGFFVVAKNVVQNIAINVLMKVKDALSVIEGS
jgi:hypothetical protein